MPRPDGKPQNRRGIGEKAEKHQRESEQERQKANAENRSRDITAAIKAVVQELKSSNDEKRPERQSDRRWERWGVKGLWAAAGVGLLAIYVSSVNSSHLYSVMQIQGSTMAGQLKETQADRRPWIASADNKFTTIQPLTWSPTEIRAEIETQIKNFGRSTASHIIFQSAFAVRPLPDAVLIGKMTDSDAMNRVVRQAIQATCGLLPELSKVSGTFLFGSTTLPYRFIVTIPTSTATFNPDSTTSAWAPFCIGYQDDLGRFHETSFLLVYSVADGGHVVFHPPGRAATVVDGVFEVYPFGADAN